MSKRAKYRIAAVTLAIFFLILGATYAVLSSRTFYPDLVFSRVQAAFESSGGYVLAVDKLEGNPITGVLGHGVKISHKGVEIAAASDVEMNLSLHSLLSGKPKLARMTLAHLRANCDEVMRHLPETKKEEKPAEPPALDKLVLMDAEIETEWGLLALERGTVGIAKDRYDLNLRGSFADKALSAKGIYIKEGNIARINRANLEWAGQRVRADGTLAPELALACELEKVDIETLSSVLPFLKKSTVLGVYSGKVTIAGAKTPTIRGQIESASGRVWRLPFTSFKSEVAYEDNEISLSGVRAKIFGADAVGDAKVGLSANAPPTLSAQFDIRKLDTKNMVAEFDFLEKFPAIIEFASCDISGPVDKLSGPVYLEIPTVKTSDFDFTGAKARVLLRGDKPLGILFSGKLLDSSLTGSGDVALTSPNRIDLDVALLPLSLASLAKQYPEIEKMKIAGNGSASAKVQGPANDLTITGSVAFPSLNVQDYSFDDVRAEFAYGAGGLSLKMARALWSGAEITADGDSRKNLLSSADQALDFRGAFSKLDLKVLGDQVGAIKQNDIRGIVSGRWALSGDTKNPAVSFDLALPQLVVGKYATLLRVGVRGVYRSSDVRIEKADARLGNSVVEGGGRVTLPAGNTPLSYEFKGSFKDLNPRDISAIAEALPNPADFKGDLNGDFRVWTGEESKPQARVFFKNSNVTTQKVEILDLSGGMELQGDDLKISNVIACLYQGNLRVNGLVKNLVSSKTASGTKGGKNAGLPLELHLDVTSVDVGRVSRIFSPSAHGYQGLIIASADVKGTTENPRFSANGNILGVRAFGLFLPRVRFSNVSGGLDSIKLPEIQAIVGRGTISASGEVTREKEIWMGSLKASGKSVDIRSMTFSLEDEMRRTITGALDFDFEGKGSLAAFQGNGTLYMPTLNVMGFKLTKVRAPFFVSDGFVMVEDSSARAYNGTVMLQVAKDLKMSRWGGRIEIVSADLGPVLPDVMPDAGGKITGKTNFKMRFGGDSRRTSMQDGEGSLEVTDGEVSGFKGAAAVSKMIGGRPLRFKSALGSFNIDGKTLYLLPGSRVAAPKGDPVFKYVMVDGSVSMAKSIDLSCVGNVNIKALNIFAGALQGLMAAAIDNKETLLQDFLGGAITGFSRNEFRDVSLRIRGTTDSVKFENVKVTQQEKLDLMPEALAEPDNTKEKDPEKIRINLEFPVGPGSDGGRNNNGAAGQVGGQVLEQAIKGILSF